MKSLFIPAIWIVTAAVLFHSGLVTPTYSLITFALYAALIAGLLIAFRFHSTRIFFALLVLFLAERAVSYFSAGNIAVHPPGTLAVAAVGLLLPLDFILLSLTQEKGFTFSSIAPQSLVLFVEAVFVAVLCRPDVTGARRALHHATVPHPLPFATIIAFATALIVLLIRFMLHRKPVESGLLWALVASFLALRLGGAGLIPSVYFATAAFILDVSILETSYLLAYHDELTTLPSRRAFNEALLRLEPPYSIAMVDIDHFKRFNDTYGHDTGDQVLRLVASRLARVAGGGQAYRYGGEEFAIIFPGKAWRDVLDHLEQLRASIEANTFRLRGQKEDRREEPRGPDRREARARSRPSSGHKIRQLSRATSPSEISVTASIGVATSSQHNSSPEKVIQSADKALYRAKAAGRNRVESASQSRRRSRSNAADIA